MDASLRIGVGPAKWSSTVRLGANVFISLRARPAREVNTIRDDVSLNPCEPEFDLVHPRRVCGREVKVSFRAFTEKLLYGFGFVSRQIIQHNVNLLWPSALCLRVRSENR